MAWHTYEMLESPSGEAARERRQSEYGSRAPFSPAPQAPRRAASLPAGCLLDSRPAVKGYQRLSLAHTTRHWVLATRRGLVLEKLACALPTLP